MKNKVVDVTPFVEIYRVYDKVNNCIAIESVSIYELYTFIMQRSPYRGYGCNRISYTLKKEPPTLYRSYTKILIKYDPPRYVIIDRYNVPVPKKVIDDAFYTNHNTKRIVGREDFRKNLIKTKRSTTKIKNTYRTVPDMWWGHGIDEPSIYYTFAELNHYRKPSTMKEIRKACADIDDYGQNIVRAKRNHKNLPNSYDDIYCDVYDTRKSWKHNSKRRKQWKEK